MFKREINYTWPFPIAMLNYQREHHASGRSFVDRYGWPGPLFSSEPGAGFRWFSEDLLPWSRVDAQAMYQSCAAKSPYFYRSCTDAGASESLSCSHSHFIAPCCFPFWSWLCFVQRLLKQYHVQRLCLLFVKLQTCSKEILRP